MLLGSVESCWEPVCGKYPGDGLEDVGFHVVPGGGGGGKRPIVVVVVALRHVVWSVVVECDVERKMVDFVLSVNVTASGQHSYVLVFWRQCWSTIIAYGI